MLAGFARADITAWEPGLTLMGWGQAWQQIEGVGLPLLALVLRLDVTGLRQNLASPTVLRALSLSLVTATVTAEGVKAEHLLRIVDLRPQKPLCMRHGRAITHHAVGRG